MLKNGKYFYLLSIKTNVDFCYALFEGFNVHKKFFIFIMHNIK